MTLTRLLTASALLVVVAAFPFPNFGPFGKFPFGGGLLANFPPSFKRFVTSSMNKLKQMIPRNTSDATKFQVIINSQGLSRRDISVNIRDGLIIVKGREVGLSDLSASAKQFSYTYNLPSNANSDYVTAELRNGELIITAPILFGSGNQRNRNVPVM